MVKKLKKVRHFKIEKKEELIKLDFGCGPNKKEGFIGVDQYEFDGKVDVVMDISKKVKGSLGDTIFIRWPWKDNSVDEAHAAHFVEHLTARERTHFVNELYRILKPGAKFTMVVPHWCAARAYGDPTHQWPPVTEFWFYYLNQEWRAANAPHTDIKHNPNGYNCHFEVAAGYSYRPDILTKSQEAIQFAQANYKEVCQDIIAYFTKPEQKNDSGSATPS